MAASDNGYGGVLPLSDWAAADRAVAEGWKLAAKLGAFVDSQTYIGGLSESHYQALVQGFRTHVQRISEILEKLKHGPVSAARRDVAVQDWIDLVNGLEAYARQITADADFGSISGAISEVGGASISDLGKLAQKVGNGAIGLLSNLPLVLGTLAVLALVLTLKPWRK